jgi:SAM-dependent methyltransferase
MIIAIKITLYAIGIVLLGCGSAILMSMELARRSAAPFFPSSKNVMRRAMKEANLKPGEIFYDLGAGTGTSLIIADKEFGAYAVGFEINILPYLIAKIKIFFRRSHAKIFFRSLLTEDFRDADVVFCFLLPRTMEKLESKFEAELKPGARLIVYTFPLPNTKPDKTIPIHAGWNIFVYKIERF